MSRAVLALLLLAVASLAACLLPFSVEGRRCDTDSDCVEGYFCFDDVCVSTESAGAFDACDATLLPTRSCESDVTGEWQVLDACVGSDTSLPRPATGVESCPGATLTAIDTDVTGDLRFDADGDANTDLSGDVFWELDVPSVCTGGVACNLFQAGVAGGSASCSDNGEGGCTCVGIKSQYERFDPVAELAANGDEVTVVGDTSYTFSVCREGGTLMLAEISGSNVGPTVLLSR